MLLLEHGLFWLTLIGAGVGAWAIYCTRYASTPARVRFGQWLFLAVCGVLGGSALLAACWRAHGLAGLGLCLGLLVVGMLWEVPAALGGARAAMDEQH